MDYEPVSERPSFSFQEALKATLEAFPEVVARDLADACGISPPVISRYRNGRIDIPSGKLQCLIRHLPQAAQAHFYALIKESSLAAGESDGTLRLMNDLRKFAKNCSGREFNTLLQVITEAREASL
ncbi:hypothetical protein C7271_01510 [filamentous cyanobacterium CCP5]|nr:hypothetical protein C7271_01510 [filamentous cyanobacterium CCP5]